MASRRPDNLSPARASGSSNQAPKGKERRQGKSRFPKEVPEKLTAAARGLGDQLFRIKNSMDKVMNTLKRKLKAPNDDNPRAVGQWNAIRKVSMIKCRVHERNYNNTVIQQFNEVITEARPQAKVGGTILDGTLDQLARAYPSHKQHRFPQGTPSFHVEHSRKHGIQDSGD